MTAPTIILNNLDITPLIKADATLTDVLAQPLSVYIQDAAIKRFEYCFELAWKTMKRILAYQGLDVNSPREILRLSAKNNLIANPEDWFNYLTKRNLTSHCYNEKIADEIYQIIPAFKKDLTTFIQTILCLSP